MRTVDQCLKLKSSFGMSPEERIQFEDWLKTDAAFSLCQALDKEEHVRRWVCDLVEGEYPWYQEKLWNKLRPWKE